MTDDLVQRLREMGEHPCRVDFPIGADLREAADRIEAQAAEIEEWRACARYDAMMEGPAFKGWDMSALERCRRAALEARGLEIREKGQ